MTHSGELENGEVTTLQFDSVTELATFADESDEILGTGHLRRDPRHAGYGLPEIRSCASACSLLAIYWRAGSRLPRLSKGQLEVPAQQVLQTEPASAIWSLRFQYPLPTAQSILEQLGEPERAKPPRQIRSQRRLDPPTDTPQPPDKVAFGAFFDPPIWFGTAPRQKPSEVILQKAPSWWMGPTKLLHCGAIGVVPAFVYENGFVVAQDANVNAALDAINHFVAVLLRSGLPSFAVSRQELVEITQFDSKTGAIGGSSASLVPRN